MTQDKRAIRSEVIRKAAEKLGMTVEQYRIDLTGRTGKGCRKLFKNAQAVVNGTHNTVERKPRFRRGRPFIGGHVSA